MKFLSMLSGSNLSIKTDAGWKDLGEVIEFVASEQPPISPARGMPVSEWCAQAALPLLRPARGRVVSDSCELAASPLQVKCRPNSAQVIFSQNCVHPVDSDRFFSDQAIFGLSAPKP